MKPRLLVLCFGNFIIGTGTLIVPGMLPALAQGLRVNVPVAAQLITAFAFTVCVTAPPLAALTARFDRRALLVAFLLLWGIGCFSTNSAQQARLVLLSPPHAPVSVAMNSSAMYFGQAVGTAAGAAVLAGGRAVRLHRSRPDQHSAVRRFHRRVSARRSQETRHRLKSKKTFNLTTKARRTRSNTKKGRMKFHCGIPLKRTSVAKEQCDVIRGNHTFIPFCLLRGPS